MNNAITAEPSFDNMAAINDFVRGKIDDFAVGKASEAKICVAVDEILSNIIKFSGASFVTVECEKKDNIIYLKFTDDGTFFNPLAYDQVNINLPLEKRKIGGLGIFMVKNSMDYVHYEYVDKKNIFIIGMNT